MNVAKSPQEGSCLAIATVPRSPTSVGGTVHPERPRDPGQSPFSGGRAFLGRGFQFLNYFLLAVQLCRTMYLFLGAAESLLSQWGDTALLPLESPVGSWWEG